MTEVDERLRRFYTDHGPAVGHWYSPRAVGWFRLDGRGATHLDRRTDVPADLFLLRVFTLDAELICETLPGDPTPLERTTTAGEQSETAPYRRLLWGHVQQTLPDGWVRLADGRVDPFDVPLTDPAGPVPNGARLCLLAAEQVGVDAHGNVVVVGERLREVAVAHSVGGAA